jgi:1,4-dihydroxy-2-naphthoate polyprenyltransferase
MKITKIGAFIRLTRPFFLLGGVLLYLLGVTITLSAGGKFNPGHFLMGQIMVTSIQLMVQYANEYFDRDVDLAGTKNRTWFSGGSGVLPSGLLEPVIALRAAQVSAGISAILLAIISIQTPVMSIIGLLVLFAAWSYSAPPLRLVSRGWGEFTASMILAIFVPLTGLVLQTGLNFFPPIFLQVCLPLVPIHMSMMIAFEFPDLETDAAFGKQTLTVRLGLRRAAWLHNGLIGGAFLFYGMLPLRGVLGISGRYILLALPLAIWQMIRIGWHLNHKEAEYHWLTTGAVSLFGLTVILLLLGFWFSG